MEQQKLYILRVIPGHERVRVEVSVGQGLRQSLSQERGRCETRVRLRGASWEKARMVAMAPAGKEVWAAEVEGLLNQADYELQVLALDGEKGVVVSSEVRLFTPGWVPGVAVDYLHREDRVYAFSGQYIGSPSIARLPDGSLVACHDVFGRGSQDFTRVFRSEDGGQHWHHAADFRPAFWGKLFVHEGLLYHLSTRTEYGDVLLRRSTDGGVTWSGPAVLAPGTYHKAPVPVIEHQGKLWTCVELQTGRWPQGFEAVALSAPADADLMDSDSWTVSEPLPYDPAWLPEEWEAPVERQGYLEGNAVVTPEGRVVNILRYNTTPYYRKAIVLDIADDGKRLSFNRVIDFYGGMTKFTIRRHPQTGVYWSLVNRVTRPGEAGMRCVLSLVSSTDLDHWKVHRDLLRDDRPWAPQYTGFQYVDWLFDGNDILAACRTAFNGARNFHDANYLTFHRIRDFAASVGEAGPDAEVVAKK